MTLLGGLVFIMPEVLLGRKDLNNISNQSCYISESEKKSWASAGFEYFGLDLQKLLHKSTRVLKLMTVWQLRVLKVVLEWKIVEEG